MTSRIIAPAALTAALFVSGLTGPAFAGEGDSCALLGLSGVDYGLCNAYCEVMECDSENPMASDVACQKLEDKIYARTGSLPPCALEADGAVIEEVATEPGYRGALVSFPDGTFQGFLDGHNQSGEFGARNACEAKLHVCFSGGANDPFIRSLFEVPPTLFAECIDACSNIQPAGPVLICSFSNCVSRCEVAFLGRPLPCE